MKVKIKLLNYLAKIPFKTHDSDACYDVIATSKKDHGNGIIEYGLGFALEPPKGTQIDLRPRSSVHKTGMILSNCIGTGDESYRGEYKAFFYNVIKELPNYEIGDKILQIQIPNNREIDFLQVNELTETKRGTGGFGSTGK